jgi:hypothetical protein
LKAAQVPSSSSLKNALIDPAVNLIIAKLKKELEMMKTKVRSFFALCQNNNFANPVFHFKVPVYPR